jgi:alkylhydroperoxidase family enzyme
VVSAKSAIGLSVRERELVILPMGCLDASAYGWKHHVPVAQELGSGDAELDAVRWRRVEAFAARDRAQQGLCEVEAKGRPPFDLVAGLESIRHHAQPAGGRGSDRSFGPVLSLRPHQHRAEGAG